MRQKLDERKNQLKAFEENNKKDEPAQTKSSRSPSPAPAVNDKLLDKKNDEDALDFEAEEGECNDAVAEETVETKVRQEYIPPISLLPLYKFSFSFARKVKIKRSRMVKLKRAKNLKKVKLATTMRNVQRKPNQNQFVVFILVDNVRGV